MAAPEPQFFLKTAPLASEPPSPYTNLYLRLHGSGINSVVLTPGPPKFIKAHLDGTRITFTSVSHAGRQWGLTLCQERERLAGWEKVEIIEDGWSEGLVFRRDEGGGEEVLEWEEEAGGTRVWKGWMVCEWASGHPQLFWVTHKLEAELPAFCHRVRIVREML